ncbi:MAG: hypothetical protein IMZ58_08215 [Thermoplasmata archaeon]|nr:hypothetical protein [Thermoplasmata archaeon]
MSVLKISFSHNYPKFHWQTTARLLYIEVHNRKDMSGDFIEYDTVYEDESGGVKGYYPFPPGVYMVLVFFGNKLIPFTTARPWSNEKERYYRSLLGKTFKINIKNKP